MAKKRSKPGKTPKPKKTAKPFELTLLTELPDEEGFDEGSDPGLLPMEFFIEILDEEGFDIIRLDEDVFLASHDDGVRLMVDIDPDMPFVTFQFPFPTLPGITKAKKYAWINQRILDYPMVRLCIMDTDLILSTFDYHYDELDFNEEHFLTHVALFWRICMEIIMTCGDGFVNPVPQVHEN